MKVLGQVRQTMHKPSPLSQEIAMQAAAEAADNPTEDINKSSLLASGKISENILDANCLSAAAT
ncbi:MAG: hypothetical protein N2491_03190 [Negativicutes bacterium]|nr:hypothetical protein [Negativicutes bacterium]